MKLLRYIQATLSLSIVGLIISCAPQSQNTIKPRTYTQAIGEIDQSLNTNQLPAVLPPSNGTSISQNSADGYVVDRVKYRLTVGGLKVCQADIIVGIRNNFQLDLPKPVFECKFGIDTTSLDLGSALGGAAANNTGSSEGPAGLLAGLSKNITDINNHIAFKEFGGFTYTPAAPIFFSPLSVPEDRLKTMDFVRSISVSGKGLREFGMVRSHIVKHKKNRDEIYGTFTSKLSKRTYQDVLTWRRETVNFSDAIKTKALLFDKMEILWSMSPTISIPRIQIVGTVQSLAGSAVGGSLPQGPIGDIIKGAKVTITLEALE